MHLFQALDGKNILKAPYDCRFKKEFRIAWGSYMAKLFIKQGAKDLLGS